MTFRQTTIDRANDLVTYVLDHEARVAEFKGELRELRELAPWAFSDNGEPLRKTEPVGGRNF